MPTAIHSWQYSLGNSQLANSLPLFPAYDCPRLTALLKGLGASQKKRRILLPQRASNHNKSRNGGAVIKAAAAATLYSCNSVVGNWRRWRRCCFRSKWNQNVNRISLLLLLLLMLLLLLLPPEQGGSWLHWVTMSEEEKPTKARGKRWVPNGSSVPNGWAKLPAKTHCSWWDELTARTGKETRRRRKVGNVCVCGYHQCWVEQINAESSLQHSCRLWFYILSQSSSLLIMPHIVTVCTLWQWAMAFSCHQIRRQSYTGCRLCCCIPVQCSAALNLGPAQMCEVKLHWLFSLLTPIRPVCQCSPIIPSNWSIFLF